MPDSLSREADLSLAGIYIYPLKSGAARSCRNAHVMQDGLEGDRRVLAVRPDGVALTGRDCPELLQVECWTDAGGLHAQAPGVDSLFLRLGELQSTQRPVNVWGQQVEALGGNLRADAWLSHYLKRDAGLAWMGSCSWRPMEGRPDQPVTFADAAPLLLTAQASLADLNCRLAQPVPMARFRPNVVIAGSSPFDEDTWSRILVGEVEFDVDGACDRCMMVTLDPFDPRAQRLGEPLATLARYRRSENGKVYFGQMLVPRSGGTVAIGQAVHVLQRHANRVVSLPPQGSLQLLTPQELSVAHPLVDDSDHRLWRDICCIGFDDVTSDMRSIHFSCEDGLPIHVKPGQYVTLRGSIGAEEWIRCYSVSSSAAKNNAFSITVKRVTGGLVSAWLHDHVRPGDRLQTMGAGGSFHFLARPARRVVLLSAGSGVSPVMGMLRWLAESSLPVDVAFHHSAHTLEDIPFADELNALVRRLEGRLRLSFNVTVASAHSDVPSVVEGRLDEQMLDRLFPDLAGQAVFACGPAGWLQAVRTALAGRLDFQADQWLEERFLPARTEGEVVHQPYEVVFSESKRTVEGTLRNTLLTIAREAGVRLSSGCESGLCGSCRCRVLSGDWTLDDACADPARSILTATEKARGIVLACTTCPSGRVVVEL